MSTQRQILEALHTAHPRMLSETVLLSDLRVQGIKISLTDLRGELRRLEEKEQAIIVNGEDATRIKITQAGIARLAE